MYRKLFILFLVLACSSAAQADWQEKVRLTASDANSEDYFGSSVSVSGKYAIVGAPIVYGSNANGSAYIFRRDSTCWNNIEQAKLTASDGNDGDQFGCSVSISGDYAIVGAHRDDDNGDESGSAYIFTPNDIDPNNWGEQAKLNPLDPCEGDFFGQCVSIDGNFAIVGTSQSHPPNPRGAAYIFERTGSSWSQVKKLTASDANDGDAFGYSVDIDGNYAIVGAIGGNAIDSGAAYIFYYDGMNWNEQAKLTAADANSFDLFGWSVAIDGNYAIVGEQEGDAYIPNDMWGAAYIFKRNGTNWTQQAKLTPANGGIADHFGQSVSISGNYAIVGEDLNDDNGSWSGAAYIFERPVSGWADTTETVKLTAPDAAAYDIFGCSVSISGNYVIVGASWDDFGVGCCIDCGSAYMFERVCPVSDLSGDCFVNFVDFGIMAGEWLQGN